MENASANPIIVTLICLVRCLVPLIIMLGISYLLKRLGLIAETPERPEEPSDNDNPNNEKGDLAHGNA
jgi:hypothetical protein